MSEKEISEEVKKWEEVVAVRNTRLPRIFRDIRGTCGVSSIQLLTSLLPFLCTLLQVSVCFGF